MSYPELPAAAAIIEKNLDALMPLDGESGDAIVQDFAEALAPVVHAVEARASQPRIVTTVEELDALPAGSIVRIASFYSVLYQKSQRGRWHYLGTHISDDSSEGGVPTALLVVDHLGETPTIAVIFEPKEIDPS